MGGHRSGGLALTIRGQYMARASYDSHRQPWVYSMQYPLATQNSQTISPLGENESVGLGSFRA